MPLYYADYADQVPHKKLEQELDSKSKGGSEKHLIAIASVLDDWENMGVALNLPRRVIEDVAKRYPCDPDKQR